MGIIRITKAQAIRLKRFRFYLEKKLGREIGSDGSQLATISDQPGLLRQFQEAIDAAVNDIDTLVPEVGFC